MEAFDIKSPRWAKYKATQLYRVMLVIPTPDGRICRFKTTEDLSEQQAAGEWSVTKILLGRTIFRW